MSRNKEFAKKVGVFMSHVGERIRHMRIKCGIINQEELAHRIGTTRQTVSLCERGIFMPDAANLSKLVKTLGTSSAYLMGETDDPEPASKTGGEKSAASRIMHGTVYKLTAVIDGSVNISVSKQHGGKTVQYELLPEQAQLTMPLIENLWDNVCVIAEGKSGE